MLEVAETPLPTGWTEILAVEDTVVDVEIP
jgi:hypothetical protein